MAAANWETIDGSTDMDALTLPLDRFCNRVMAWAQSRMDEKEWGSFTFRLNLPPIGETPVDGPWSAEAIAATFSDRDTG